MSHACVQPGKPGGEERSWKPAVLFCFVMSIIRPFYCFSFSHCWALLEKKHQPTNSAIPHGLRRRHPWHFIRAKFLLFGYFIFQQCKRTLKWEQIISAGGCLCWEKTFWLLCNSKKPIFSLHHSLDKESLCVISAVNSGWYRMVGPHSYPVSSSEC